MSIDTSTEIHRKLVERWISMTFTDRAVLTEALSQQTLMILTRQFQKPST